MYETSLMDAAGMNSVERTLLEITWQMLEAIHTGDAELYASLSAPEMSCFEDVCDYRIDGVEFHMALIRQMAQNTMNRPIRFDILSPRVQIYGDTGIVTYTRLMTYDDIGKPKWNTYNETRVFVCTGASTETGTAPSWKMVHFHRSPT